MATNGSSFEEQLQDVMLHPAKYLPDDQKYLPSPPVPKEVPISRILDQHKSTIVENYQNIFNAVSEVAKRANVRGYLFSPNATGSAVLGFKISTPEGEYILLF